MPALMVRAVAVAVSAALASVLFVSTPARAADRNVAAMGAVFAPGIQPRVGQPVPGTQRLPSSLRNKLKITGKISNGGLTLWSFSTGGITQKQAKTVCGAMVAAKAVLDPRYCDVMALVTINSGS